MHLFHGIHHYCNPDHDCHRGFLATTISTDMATALVLWSWLPRRLCLMKTTETVPFVLMRGAGDEPTFQKHNGPFVAIGGCLVVQPEDRVTTMNTIESKELVGKL